MLRQAAEREGWTYVSGVFDSFKSHGYAAKDRWFVRAKESEQIQGPILSPIGYLRGEIAPGMLHPNLRGHQAIAEQLFVQFHEPFQRTRHTQHDGLSNPRTSVIPSVPQRAPRSGNDGGAIELAAP